MNPEYWTVTRIEVREYKAPNCYKAVLIGSMDKGDNPERLTNLVLQTALFPTEQLADTWSRNAAVIHGLRAVHWFDHEGGPK